MNLGILYAFLVAVGFGAWPLVARYSGASPAWSTTIVMSFTSLIIAVCQASDLRRDPMNWKMMAMLVLPTAMNAGAMLIYGKKVISSTSLMAISAVFMILVPVLFGIVFLDEPVTAKKLVGFIAGLLTVYCLTP